MAHIRVANNPAYNEIQLENSDTEVPYLWNLQLVRENRQILKDCVDEAFNMRSIPFALVFALGAHKAIQKGFVRPSRIFGSFPLMIGSSMLGCFVGLYSYRNKCAEKFQNYYDSKFGDFLRLNRNGQSLYGSTIGAEGEDVKKFMQPNSLDLDTERSNGTELDDFRLNMDDRLFKTILGNQKNTIARVTYAELRRKNRENYDRMLNEM